jgi:hypothetical protein
MDWLLRFTLGLPAREQDIAAVKKTLPELADSENGFSDGEIYWPLYPRFRTSKEFIDELRNWIKCAEETDSDWVDATACPESNCPMRHIQHSSKLNNDEPVILEMLVMGGGPSQKTSKSQQTPKARFFDLVRKAHKNTKLVREVILTDPYIYSDVSEDGIEGGSNNLIEYLQTLGLSQEDHFSLITNPSPKRGNKQAKTNLQKMIKNHYSNISFRDFSPSLKFHDRFYLVRYKSGDLKGVFGPSLNGLNSDAIVVMGDIDDIKLLKQLQQLLD